jgi:hypothetical protein
MTAPIGLISIDPLTKSVFYWTPHVSRSFKLPNLSAPQFRGRIAWVAKTERHLSLGKRIVTLSLHT